MLVMANSQATLQYNGKKVSEAVLPPLPAVAYEAAGLIRSGKTGMAKIAAVISKDPALSAKVLKVINSPTYGFAGRISTIKNALTLLGYNVVYNIIISTVVTENIPKDMAGMWEHCYCCSLACGHIATRLGLPEVSESVVAGLLHDFGKTLINTNFPDAYEKITHAVRDEDVLFFDAEKKVLGFSHTDINAWIADQWRLPLCLREPMIYHHAPMEAPTQKTLSGVVHLGDFFVRLFERGSGGDCNVSKLDFAVLRHLGIDKDMLPSLVDELGALLNAST